MRDAYKNKMLSENPAENIKSIKLQDTQREFLTLEELQKLAEMPFEYDDLRRASLFSALTGLRYSDIAKLIRKEIQQSDASGKSVCFDIMKALFGAENITSFSLNNLNEEHNRALMNNKLLNYSSELGGKKAIDSDLFKKLVSGEPVQCRLKYE